MKKIFALVLVLMFVVFVSGCVSQSSISSQEEASEAVQDISEDIDNLGSSFEEIDSGLNG